MRSGTKSRILATALDLFNLEGEGEVSATDIAAVLGISPGNLYYHFRGKEPMVEALFDDFERELREVLDAPIARPLAIEDNWIYLFIVFEEIWDFRFFFRDPAGFVTRVPELRERFARLLRLMEETAKSLLSELQRLEAVAFRDTDRDALAARLAQHMSLWINYRTLRSAGRDDNKRDLINSGVHQAMLMIAPYVVADAAFVEGVEAAAEDAPV